MKVPFGGISWHCIAWNSSESSGLQLPVSTADTVYEPFYLKKSEKRTEEFSPSDLVSDQYDYLIELWKTPNFQKLPSQTFCLSFWFGSYLYGKKSHISLLYRHAWQIVKRFHQSLIIPAMATLLMPWDKNLNLASNINTFFSTLPAFTKITYVANLTHFNMFSSFIHSEIENKTK